MAYWVRHLDLPRSALGLKRVEVVVLDEVEHHLHRCHSEMVGPHVQHRQLKHLHLLSHRYPSVIVGIVQHEDSSLSPLGVLPIKMDAQLGQKEAKGVPIGNSNIDRVQEFTSAAQRSNDIYTLKTTGGGHLVLLVHFHPSMLTVVCEPDDCLVDINDAGPTMQSLDVLGRSILSLKLGRDVVLDDLDWFDLPVGSRQLAPQVPTQPWSTDP